MWAKHVMGFSILAFFSTAITIISLLAVREHNKAVHVDYLPTSLVKLDTFSYTIDPGMMMCNTSCNCWPDTTWCQICPVTCYNTTVTFNYNLASSLIREYGPTNQTVLVWSEPTFSLTIPVLTNVELWYNICAYTVLDPASLTRCGQHGITTPIFINTLVPYQQVTLDTTIFTLVGVFIVLLIINVSLIFYVINLEKLTEVLPPYY